MRARERAGSKDPALVITASDLLLVGRLLQACDLLLRLARDLASMFERNAAERFGPLLEEALVSLVPLLEYLEDPARKLLVSIRLTLHALSQGPSDLLGYLVVPLAGDYPVLGRYPGAILCALGVGLGDPAQVLKVRLGHGGRGHLIDTSVGSGLVQFQTHIFTVYQARLNILGAKRQSLGCPLLSCSTNMSRSLRLSRRARASRLRCLCAF